MVDFQKRDTRRDLREDEEDEADDEPEMEHGAADDDQHGHGSNDGGDHGHVHEHHDHHAHDVESVGVGVVTVSSSRSLADDPSGDAIVAALEGNDDRVVTRELVRDEFDAVQRTVDQLTGRRDVEAVVTTGGTGVTPDDVTVEAVRSLFDKELPGFGELFRSLSFDEIGTRVVGTRAIAGVADGVPVFCLPGSENAARLGAEQIVVHEVGHLAGLARREADEE